MKTFLLLPALFLLASCDSGPRKTASVSPFDDPEVVAIVGEEKITRAQVTAMLGEHPAAAENVLDQLIEQRALVQAARASGMESDPDFVAAVERLMARRMKEKMEQQEPAEITEAQVTARYEANPQRWTLPARARFAMIFIETPSGCSAEKKAELQTAMNGIRSEALTDPASFNALAAQHSSDQASRYQGGDIGYVVEGAGAEEVDAPALAAAFALKQPGEMTHVIATERGLWLLRLTDRTAASLRPLTAVKEQIRAELRREADAARAEREKSELLAGRRVERRPDRLPASNLAAARPDAPPAPPR